MLLSRIPVEDTISMLRGLTDRYEAHHGVHISDSALVAAAQMSDRYITHRFNPDKSIGKCFELPYALISVFKLSTH